MKRILLLFIMLGLIRFTSAQDIHFSQYYAAPFNLNPSAAGLFDGKYRAGLIHRNQWSSIEVPFVTSSGFFDTKVLEQSLSTGFLGVGLNLFTDNAANGTLTSNALNIALAYHTYVDPEETSRFVIGISGGYQQKSLDFNQLTFENQFDDSGFNTSLPTGETGTSNSVGFPDFQAGLAFTSQVNEKMGYTIGFAAQHLTTPNESFIDNGAAKLDRRMIGHAELRVGLNENLSVLPKIAYMNQAKSQELNLSGLLGYTLAPSTTTLYLGSSYRMSTWDKNLGSGIQSDALIILTGIHYGRFDVGFSYDVNISGLRELSRGKGAYEISLIYTGFIEAISIRKQVPCRRI